ncbi:MAG: hypothetical protein QG639_32, partial [Patescibacteria group bacterium]|nr:hypothetical protein [Patescibacteria group bacterium]
HSVTTAWLEPIAIDVEITTTSGIPHIFIIGMAATTAREAKDRIITALKTIGIRLKARKTVISLTPAEIKKSGSTFDLAIAVALLSLYSKIFVPLKKTVFVGEVSIDGSIHPVENCLGKVVAAKKLGYQQLIVPIDNLRDCVLAKKVTILGITHLKQLLNNEQLEKLEENTFKHLQNEKEDVHIVGQSEAIRAITIAVAGRHHLHFIGPPGVGKSKLPLFAAAIQPSLSQTEALEVSLLYSCVQQKYSRVFEPPFRSPHHSATTKKIIGYDSQLLPGELSLAHRGILFLDELPLFSQSTLQALRTPLDQKELHLQNKNSSTILPCNCLVIASSNPCPCGFWQTGIKACTCSIATRKNYLAKLSWPLLERLDLQVFVTALSSIEYEKSAIVHSSRAIAKTVLHARKIQSTRYQDHSFFNADLKLSSISNYCTLEKEAHHFLQKAVATYNVSTRGYQKIIGVAQTICDLEDSPVITVRHCAEALQYRPTPLISQ